MYLKSLELHGFKSFPNRTVLTFERGATVIVGPNGSGKSNISDAMRWVLGELSSRNLRGTKMEDVIFGGTDSRRPMGFAEVSVTFDNSDPDNRLDSEFDEVTVTRRYYRTGESEYLINRQPKRLRDIYELFMNTGVGREGYSIIGQGKIAEIISKKSDERRNIFEEAAGISKYRHRKEETERKLANTQLNIDRVKDILTELESRVIPLEKEAERARKGLAIYEEKKRADVSLWLYDTKKIHEDIEKADNARKLAQRELEIVEQAIADLDAQNDNLYAKMQENKLLSANLYDKINSATERLHQIDNEMRSAESDFAHSLERINEAKNRIREIDGSEESLKKSRSEYDTKAEGFRKTLKELLDKRLEYLAEQQRLIGEISKAKHDLEETLDELTVEENSATDLKVRIDVLRSSSRSDTSKSHDIESEIEKYEEEGRELKAEADRCEENASEFKEKIAAKEKIVSESSEKIESLTEEKNEITDNLNALILERDSLNQRAEVLRRMAEHFEGYAESVKYVMREYQAGKIDGAGTIYGPLSSLVNVNKDYITAIETALGSSLQNIVADNERTVKAAINLLKRDRAGRATFYPLSEMRPTTETPEMAEAKKLPGFVGRADTLVDSEPQFRVIVEWLLLRTLVFDNIDNATVAAKKMRYRVRIVTLDGQIINVGASFTGGSAKRDSGMLSRMSQITELGEKAEKLSKTIKDNEDALAEINGELSEAQNTMRAAEEERDILLTLSRTQFAALDNANARYGANRNIVEKLRADFDNLTNSSTAAGEEIVSLTAEYKANCERIEALKSYRQRRSEEMGVIDEKSDEMGNLANDIFIKATEARKDVELVESTMGTIDARLTELSEERDAQNARIKELEDKRMGLDSSKQERYEEYKKLEEELDKLTSERKEVESGNDEYDREINNIRIRLREKQSSREASYEANLKAENKFNQLEERRDKLSSQLWDDYEITYDDAVALQYPPVTEENREEIAAIQTSCRGKLRALGGYNPGAIEEYAEVKIRYDDLNTQYTDLTNSHKELIDIIARLEDEMRISFVTAFEAINKNFGITFRELFGGGSAELSLTEPEDVLTSGIEIKAAPPGKIIKSMSLLSGGEQSFVAIALLFAILKVNPTPFCILDEIEAALDEVNVYRFGEYVRSFDKNTQFILITHRRGTMEIGDRLYGVTMPQRGISQAIEINVDEIEGRQEELLDGVL